MLYPIHNRCDPINDILGKASVIKMRKSGAITQDTKKKARKVLSVIAPLYFFALLISAVIISSANDVYAFCKPQVSATISIEHPLCLGEFSELLSQHGIISNEAVFRLYVSSKNAEQKIENFTGEITLSSNMSYREILSNIK